MSIFSSFRYCLSAPSDLSQLYLAMFLVPLGLFFDFMDGKVARWRKKSSLMGQELDSLADLVRNPLWRLSLTRQLTFLPTDLVWSGPRFVRVRARIPLDPRHGHPLVLCALRPLAPREIQRHGSEPAQGRHRQEQVL